MKFRLACAAGLVAVVAMAEVVQAKGLVDYPGVVDEKSGWRCVASEAGKTVYVPFEGYYESKGGRIESPKFELDKAPEENAWYEFSFQAKSSVEGFWWVDVFDAKGAPMPDMNSRLYVSDDWRPYKVVVSMQCGTKQAQLAFVTTKGVSVRDVSFRRITVKAAADWCRELYRTLPQVDLSVPADAWDRLPRAKKLLTEGKPIRILLLGDSNVNDTWCGNVAALICEKFPNARLSLSVRGSTGCWYYREPEHFEEYVLRYKPDLLLFGGAASGRFDADFSRAEEDLTAVVDLARKNGIEICIMSPAPSYEFRKTPEDASWDENFVHARYEDWAKKVVHIQPMRRDFQRKVVAKRGVAYFDLTTATCDAILRSRKPLDWFKRDIAHNDDRGKQLIAQRLAAYFNVLESRKTSELEAARNWLEEAAKRTVAGAERRMDSGLAVYNPDVGGSYRATWLRDYAYMLEADAVPHAKIGGASRLFVAAVSTNGWGVDCIKYDGSPVYMPGYGTMGRLAVADGSPFTVDVAYLSWKVTEDSAWLKPDVLEKLERTMAAAPVREGSPLAYISPNEPWERASYGFTDSVRKKGHCLFESLLLFEAERRLGEMLRAAGQEARAVGHESRARAIAAAVNATFWDDAAGLYRAATVTCREHDVWGSAFAVWLGVADGGRADEVSRALARHYDGLVWKGQVRHNLPGRYWEASNCGRDSYQNGGFWGTPVGWVAWALERTAPELVDNLYRDLVADYRANGVCEWTFGDRRACNKGYPASVCLPLAAVRRILAVRRKSQGSHDKERRSPLPAAFGTSKFVE